jgi:hypothetical protein
LIIHPVRVIVFFGLSFAASLAHAAGTFEDVNIQLFQPGKNGQYSMIVAPVSYKTTGSLIGLCKQLRVFGSFDDKHWASNNKLVNREGHSEALALLQSAFQQKKPVKFGELGAGFRVSNKTMPCTVKSRGLVFWKDANTEAALSVYQAL